MQRMETYGSSMVILGAGARRMSPSNYTAIPFRGPASGIHGLRRRLVAAAFPFVVI